MKHLLAKLTGKRYWYVIQVNYIINGRRIADTTREIGLTHPHLSLSRRTMASTVGQGLGIYEDKALHNCTLEITVLSNLGYFKAQKKDIKR